MADDTPLLLRVRTFVFPSGIVMTSPAACPRPVTGHNTFDAAKSIASDRQVLLGSRRRVGTAGRDVQTPATARQTLAVATSNFPLSRLSAVPRGHQVVGNQVDRFVEVSVEQFSTSTSWR